MKSNSKNLILVDGSSYLFRAYYALPPLTNKDGMPTGAIYGVINMLRQLIESNPDKMAVVFDAKGPTFRHEIFPEYKANRGPMPDDLAVQIQPLKDLIIAMGVPVVCISGVEADDVMGTLARRATADGYFSLISTSDKDMAQLVVDGSVELVNTMSGLSMDEAGVFEKFGVKPGQIIDYLSLIGDTSDNIPGVYKVGPKTAQKWLSQYNTLDNIVANAASIKGKVGENLRDALDDLPLSKQLVTIDTDVSLDISIDDLNLQPMDISKLHGFYSKFGFKRLLKSLDETKNQTKNKIGEDVDLSVNEKPALEVKLPSWQTESYEAILTIEQLSKWVELISESKFFAFDCETDGLDSLNCRLVGLSFAVSDGRAAYLPLLHDAKGAPKQLDWPEVLQLIQPLFSSKKIIKIAHNLKFDWEVLSRHGLEIVMPYYDTLLSSYIVSSLGRHDMDTLSEHYLGHKTISFEDLAGKGKNQKTFNQVDLEQAVTYAAEDADVTCRLYQCLEAKLANNPSLQDVYSKIELPLVAILADMESYGVLLDIPALEKQSESLGQKIDDLKQAVFKLADEEFNLDSPKQLVNILFEKLDLPIISKTPKGQPSTAESVLEELAISHDICEKILAYRSLNKLKNTYTDKLPTQASPETSRVHTSYHQSVTSTGRLSSSNPNLQNIPIRSPEGQKIRDAFIAPKNHVIMSIDYSQIELRIMAHLSGDETLISAFNNDEDIHAKTATELFGDLDITPEEARRRSKAINFGLIYGMSAFGLAKQLGVSRGDAQEYIDLYFKRYPGVRVYMEQTRIDAAKYGYVKTLSGRLLYLPDINAKNRIRRQAAERAAINAPMQGTAADIIKLAMIGVAEYLNKQHAKSVARMILQVHDELIFEVSEDAVNQVKEDITKLMVEAFDLNVPLKVSVGIGRSWGEAH